MPKHKQKWVFRLCNTDGKEIITDDMPKFCEQHAIDAKKLRQTAYRKKVTFYRSWRVVESKQVKHSTKSHPKDKRPPLDKAMLTYEIRGYLWHGKEIRAIRQEANEILAQYQAFAHVPNEEY